MSNGMKWIKLHTSLLSDPKFANMTVSTWTFWVRLLLATGLHGNASRLETPRVTDALSMLHADPRYFEEHLNRLAKLGVLKWNVKADGALQIDIVRWSRYQSGTYMEAPEEGVEEKREEEKRYTPSQAEQNAIRKQAEDIFASVTGLSIPTRKKEAGELWWVPLRELCALAQWKSDWTERLIRRSIDELKAGGMNIGSPKSLVKQARSIVAKANMNTQKPDTNGKDREVIGWDRFTGEVLYS